MVNNSNFYILTLGVSFEFGVSFKKYYKGKCVENDSGMWDQFYIIVL